jgi:hypothetical protein
VAAETTLTFSCSGGLDKASNAIQLFKTPGAATRLVNYESAITGGYRRIDGYAKWGGASATQPAGTTSKNLGVFRYADGVVACQGTGVYFSTDGITWIQVNKQGASLGIDITALGAATEEPRTSQSFNSISLYEGNEEYGILILTDGVNEIAHFKITDTGGRKYYYEELVAASGAPVGAKYNIIYSGRSVTHLNSTVYWSGRYTPDDFTLASAGAVDVGDKITGLKVHRENLYVFCKNSIHVISNIDQNPSRVPVTRNIGCVEGCSIQEIGGDLIFLAQDGLRTIAGTDRIDDVEMSTVSGLISPIVKGLADNINTYDVSSTVIRSKNQYRLFYTKSANSTATQQGIIGVLKYGVSGITWEWSETLGIEAVRISSEMDKDTLEKIYHGDYDGWIYDHISGTSFNGAAVKAIYKTPDIDYGDIGLRKSLHSLKLSIKAETSTNLSITIRYNFGSNSIMHPQPYLLDTVNSAAIYGIMTYGSFYYGSPVLPLIKLNIEGSGGSNSFQFETNDTTSLYTISGFYVDVHSSGRVD